MHSTTLVLMVDSRSNQVLLRRRTDGPLPQPLSFVFLGGVPYKVTRIVDQWTPHPDSTLLVDAGRYLQLKQVDVSSPSERLPPVERLVLIHLEASNGMG